MIFLRKVVTTIAIKFLGKVVVAVGVAITKKIVANKTLHQSLHRFVEYLVSTNIVKIVNLQKSQQNRKNLIDLECNGKLRSKFLIFFEKVSLKSIILGLIIPCITFTFDIPRKNRFFKSIITYLIQTKDMRMIHPNLCNF